MTDDDHVFDDALVARVQRPLPGVRCDGDWDCRREHRHRRRGTRARRQRGPVGVVACLIGSPYFLNRLAHTDSFNEF